MKSFQDARDWIVGNAGKSVNLLLGNGFSMAYDRNRFGYAALADSAIRQDWLPASAVQLMEHEDRPDFEWAMRRLESTVETLRILDPEGHADLLESLSEDVERLREALARSIAGLHPDRPYEIDKKAYVRVREFLEVFKCVYTVNYDLLLYWSLMQDVDGLQDRRSDDGFRDSGVDGDDTVKWNIYDGGSQNIHYLHGALHLFVGLEGLRKITWKRTDYPLIDQVRDQLAQNRYPLYVAESDSAAKLSRINSSGYLTRSLRSLANCSNGLMVLGHSLDANDDHILEAIVRSTVRRVAISIFGDPSNESNMKIQQRAKALQGRRSLGSKKVDLEVDFFDAESVPLWH